MSKDSKYTKKDLERIRKNLPPKWAVALKQETGYSISYIRKTLYGVVENQLILNAAFKLINKYHQEIESGNKTLKNL